MKKALYWEKKGDKVRCTLCPRYCVLSDGQVGACGVRRAKNGLLYALNYAKPCSLGVDPVEKKPLFHFHPGEPIFSLATIGCNLYCDFCQNWEISRAKSDSLDGAREVSPEEIIALAEERGCRLIAFTYTEPTIYYEYALDVAKLAKAAGMECVIVSNGYINKEPLAELSPFLSAANIDLKGRPAFYKKRCKVPDATRVKETIKELRAAGVHVEVTMLVVPGENDADESLEGVARWVAEHVGKDTPLHYSAFHPEYKMRDRPRTPVETLLRARELARKHLDFVYLGNVAGVENETRCPACGELCIARPFSGGHSFLKKGECPRCGNVINGCFSGGEGE